MISKVLFISEKHVISKDEKKRGGGGYEEGGEQWVKGTAGACVLPDMGVLSVAILLLLWQGSKW